MTMASQLEKDFASSDRKARSSVAAPLCTGISKEILGISYWYWYPCPHKTTVE